ncbi:MAG: carbohydrate ABC transporter permease [Oscillospiraceae bacterium]
MTTNQAAHVKSGVWRWVSRILLIALTLIVLYPFLWNFIASMKTNTEFLTDPFAMPKGFHIENYLRAFTKAKMSEYFINSVFMVIFSTAVMLAFVIPISYTLSRYKFIGSKLILNIYMACIFIQATYIMVPLFLQMNRFHLLDNLPALGTLYAVLQFPFAIFVLSGFIRTIPKDYEEAACIDGCSNFGILIKIIMPMSRPGIATVAMLSAMGFWNEYPLALIFIQTDSKKTLPVGLANLFEVQRYATDWGALFAALIIVLVPTVILFLIGQKQLLQGINVGGIKG